MICKQISMGFWWARGHILDAGEEAQGRLGSGADRGETGLATGHGVLGMAQRESLVLWLWPLHNTGHYRLQDGPSVREGALGLQGS